tara:strand:- start:358 stop:597 length:240 start_codon:yes stop_codon:yes gene_type:complete
MNLKKCNQDYFEALKERREASASPLFKICFECKFVRTIEEFTDNNKKYQREAAKGKNHLCIHCLEKRKNGIKNESKENS